MAHLGLSVTPNNLLMDAFGQELCLLFLGAQHSNAGHEHPVVETVGHLVGCLEYPWQDALADLGVQGVGDIDYLSELEP